MGRNLACDGGIPGTAAQGRSERRSKLMADSRQ